MINMSILFYTTDKNWLQFITKMYFFRSKVYPPLADSRLEVGGKL